MLEGVEINGRWEVNPMLVKEEVRSFLESRFIEHGFNRP